MLDKKSLIHWTRVILGAITGIICGLMKFQLESAGKGILLGSVFYILSYYIIVYVYKIRPDDINIKMRDIFITGAGSFVIIWLYLWILILNFLYFP